MVASQYTSIILATGIIRNPMDTYDGDPLILFCKVKFGCHCFVYQVTDCGGLPPI